MPDPENTDFAFQSREDCPLPEVPRIRPAELDECLINRPPLPILFGPPPIPPITPPGVTPPNPEPPVIPPPPPPPPHISCAEIEVRSESRYEHADARALEKAAKEFEQANDRAPSADSADEVSWVATRASAIYNEWWDDNPVRPRPAGEPLHVISNGRAKEYLEFRRLRQLESKLKRVLRIFASQTREVKAILAEVEAATEEGEAPVYPTDEDISLETDIPEYLVTEMRLPGPFKPTVHQVLAHKIFVDLIAGGGGGPKLYETLEWLMENPLSMSVESDFDSYDDDNCFPIVHINPVVPCPTVEVETEYEEASDSGEPEFEAEVDNLDPCGFKLKLRLAGVGTGGGMGRVTVRRIGSGSVVGDVRARVRGNNLELIVVKTDPMYC